jgi:hypothetical protein
MLSEAHPVHVAAIEIDMLRTGNLHFVIDSPGHNISWRQVSSLIIALHKRLAMAVAQNAAIATYGFCNQEGLSAFAGFVKRRGMKLDEFHVFNAPLGPVYHGHAIARWQYKGWWWCGTPGRCRR